MDILTDAWVRELVQLLAEIDRCRHEKVSTELVKDLIGAGGLGVLMDFYWYAQSVLIIQYGNNEPPSEVGEGGGRSCGDNVSNSSPAQSEVTVEVGEDDNMEHSIFTILLKILSGMLRRTPTTVQILYDPVLLHRLSMSLYIMSVHGPLCPFSDEVAFLHLISFLKTALKYAPDLRPLLFDCGLFYYLLCASIGHDGKGIMMIETAHICRDYHMSEDNASVFQYLLPYQLIKILSHPSASAEKFREVFNSTTAAPDVIWNKQSRLACLKFLKSHMSQAIDHALNKPLAGVASTYITSNSSIGY